MPEAALDAAFAERHPSLTPSAFAGMTDGGGGPDRAEASRDRILRRISSADAASDRRHQICGTYNTLRGLYGRPARAAGGATRATADILADRQP